MIFFVIALGIAALDWFALAKGYTRLGYFTKPGVIVALLLGVWVAGGLPTPNGEARRLWWIAAGLLFSLAGDILLMLPRERFIAAMAVFVLGYGAYIPGLGGLPYRDNLLAPGLLITIPVLAVSGRVFIRVMRSLAAKGQKKLTGPAAIFGLVQTAMVLAALFNLIRHDWTMSAAYLVSGGGLLIYFSDLQLAWNRFVSPLKNARFVRRILYYLGQIALAGGMTLHFVQISQ